MDKSNMKKTIINFPNQLEEGLCLGKEIKGNFKNIVICGMGGSALPGDILSSLTDRSFYIHRNYDLPLKANKKSLIICISYSGNTEETISSFKKAIKNNFKVVAISSGGKIEKIAKENNIPFVKIPSGIQPRCAVGYIFSSLVKIIGESSMIEKEIILTVKKLKGISLEKKGKKIADEIKNKVPLIYSSEKLKNIALIWKIKFNENSKTPAFFNFIPELNHNEMVGFKDMKNFFILFFKDEKDDRRVLKRIDLTAKLAKKYKIKTKIINIEKGSLLFKIFTTLILGDWVSYYLAIKKNQDPSPVKIIEEFKKNLK